MSERKLSDSVAKIVDALKSFEDVVRTTEKAAIAPMSYASVGLSSSELKSRYVDALTGVYEAITDAGVDMSMVMPEPPFRFKGMWCKSETKENPR